MEIITAVVMIFGGLLNAAAAVLFIVRTPLGIYLGVAVCGVTAGFAAVYFGVLF